MKVFFVTMLHLNNPFCYYPRSTSLHTAGRSSRFLAGHWTVKVVCQGREGRQQLYAIYASAGNSRKRNPGCQESWERHDARRQTIGKDCEK
jgi:hypothetical protein